jgi:hypothetical protein
MSIQKPGACLGSKPQIKVILECAPRRLQAKRAHAGRKKKASRSPLFADALMN